MEINEQKQTNKRKSDSKWLLTNNRNQALTIELKKISFI